MKIVFTRFFSAILLLCTMQTNAQFIYNFSHYYQAYTPLSGATNMNTGIWDTATFSAPIPFTFHIGTYAINNFFLDMSRYGVDFLTDTSGLVNFADFSPCDAILADRGLLPLGSTTSKSPVRYSVSGSTGNRIFKAEIANAGFLDEIAVDSTLGDSVSLQVWLYEDSNIVEYRYGPSKISHPCDYFTGCDSPFISFFYKLDTHDDGEAYFLTGNLVNPIIDSAYYVDSIQTNNFTIGPLIFGWPASGTVYRFTPKLTSGVNNINTAGYNLRIYPTICSSVLNVNYNGNDFTKYEVISINGTICNLKGILSQGISRIDISGLAPGMYLLRSQNAEGVNVQKFVKM